jgi:transcriptional activator protein UGA3
MIEICDGNSTKWSWHISAAQTIIRSDKRLRSESSTTTWRFLLAVFAYVDSVIAISNCQAPLITLEELARDEKFADASVSSPRITPYTSHNEALFGIALPLFDIIGKISDLANRRKDRIDEISELWFRQSATRIETDLRDWEPDTAQHSTDRNSRDLFNAAYTIKWASILRLHQVVEDYNRSDPCVSECTSKIFDQISEIHFVSLAEHILIFPFVMAASGCQADEQRVTMREIWMIMERTLGFDNIYHAREMIEAVWKTMDQGFENGTEEEGMTVNLGQD